MLNHRENLHANYKLFKKKFHMKKYFIGEMEYEKKNIYKLFQRLKKNTYTHTYDIIVIVWSC